MSENSYETGRLNLPFVGICTFAKSPLCLDWDKIDADVAVMGAPFDCGTQWRAGARFGPRSIRDASTLFSFGHGGAYDFEDDVVYLPSNEVRIVDIGDADMVHTNTEKSHANIEYGVRKILAAGALPVVMGGDHSINIPCINAFEGQEPFHIVHIDAHLDFVDERHGVRHGHGNPLRRAAEKSVVSGYRRVRGSIGQPLIALVVPGSSCPRLMNAKRRRSRPARHLLIPCSTAPHIHQRFYRMAVRTSMSLRATRPLPCPGN